MLDIRRYREYFYRFLFRKKETVKGDECVVPRHVRNWLQLFDIKSQEDKLQNLFPFPRCRIGSRVFYKSRGNVIPLKLFATK